MSNLALSEIAETQDPFGSSYPAFTARFWAKEELRNANSEQFQQQEGELIPELQEIANDFLRTFNGLNIEAHEIYFSSMVRTQRTLVDIPRDKNYSIAEYDAVLQDLRKTLQDIGFSPEAAELATITVNAKTQYQIPVTRMLSQAATGLPLLSQSDQEELLRTIQVSRSTKATNPNANFRLEQVAPNFSSQAYTPLTREEVQALYGDGFNLANFPIQLEAYASNFQTPPLNTEQKRYAFGQDQGFATLSQNQPSITGFPLHELKMNNSSLLAIVPISIILSAYFIGSKRRRY